MAPPYGFCKIVEAAPINTKNSTTQTMVKTRIKPTGRCVAKANIFINTLFSCLAGEEGLQPRGDREGDGEESRDLMAPDPTCFWVHDISHPITFAAFE
jgi:hypothetical protein